MDSMEVIGRKLLGALIVASLFGGCSIKDRIPDVPIPKVPKIGKREPDLPPTVGAVGTGSHLFYQNCAKCHGDPPSPGFVEIMKGVSPITNPQRVRELDQVYVYRIISEGGGGVGRRATMPSFKEVLTEEEIRRIVSYLNGNPI